MNKTRLYVIEQSGRAEHDRVFWSCSSEHGCGWNPGNPKQAFSPSELTAQLRSMIDHGYICDVIVRELFVRSDPKTTESDAIPRVRAMAEESPA